MPNNKTKINIYTQAISDTKTVKHAKYRCKHTRLFQSNKTAYLVVISHYPLSFSSSPTALFRIDRSDEIIRRSNLGPPVPVIVQASPPGNHKKHNGRSQHATQPQDDNLAADTLKHFSTDGDRNKRSTVVNTKPHQTVSKERELTQTQRAHTKSQTSSRFPSRGISGGRRRAQDR